MAFSEDSRVKIPAILHLERLGYQYLSLKDPKVKWDEATNIFTDIFIESISRINPGVSIDDINRLLIEIKLLLDNEDLGRAFHELLVRKSDIRLVDFNDFENNSFNVVTELTYKNGEEEFRPDIILLINGLPLSFIEVKKPLNREGILQERDRIIRRFQNPKFRHFVNITQLMIFSNNMEYEDSSPTPLEGAFYASASYKEPIFNYFREEDEFDLAALLKPENEEIENFVLKDNNLSAIKHNPEFSVNKAVDSPTHRIFNSLLSLDRLKFMLKYSIAYVEEDNGLEKHVMRYPQIFATKAITKKLSESERKGIIWHTQGSGKTALAYYNVQHLTDYFQGQSVVPKFYFIVDRIDLATQAKREFRARGLSVHVISSRDDFAKDIKQTSAIHNALGTPEITVVNIQKFKDDPSVVSTRDYNVNIQRVYFLDEVHRSYNPKGSFLANLNESDPNAIKIGLTGTPLLGDDYNSRTLFGGYFHKYYYNSSIADGYTLRLIREEIATNYKLVLQKALEDLRLHKGDIDRKDIYADPSFVEPMLDYVVEDFETFRKTSQDPSIGAMVICDSAPQAKEMFDIFSTKYAINPSVIESASDPLQQAAENRASYGEIKASENQIKTAAVILHDVGTKEERKNWVEDFKAGNIDLLFVFNMLLTGFDAKRLKKLYLGRVIKSHNLLQALTRVNRPYKKFSYGYVVDFADISSEFEETNKAYWDELQEVAGNEIDSYSNLFKSKEEIEAEIEEIKDVLFQYDTENAELFSQQIQQIQNKDDARQLKRALGDARSLYNLIRLSGNYELLEQLDFNVLNKLYGEVSRHIDMLNLRERLANSTDTGTLLHAALENVVFMFEKVGEEELVLADELKDKLRRTREALGGNFDPKDPEFITLKEELERLFKKKKLSEVSQEEMTENIESLDSIHARIQELNRKNNLLKAKYQNDPKYARIHKKIIKEGRLGSQERKIFSALTSVKNHADEEVLNNTQLLNNEDYFGVQMMPLVIQQFKNEQNLPMNPDLAKYINQMVVTEYMNEFNGVSQW